MASREALLGCIDRELRMRERLYPKWVARGRMSQSKADEELRLLREVRDIVDEVKLAEQAELFPDAPAPKAVE